MQGTYNLWLVACSYLVAVTASYAALELAGRIVASTGRATWVWLAAGSVAMGLGIWSMHFIGMLAFHLPIPLAYDTSITLLSVLPAVLASALALGLIRGGVLSGRRLILGAVLMGGGIAAMHYTGMAAIPVVPAIRYDPPIFAASIVVAIVVAFAALWLAFSLSGSRSGSKKLGAALVMGGAVCAMHYTGMAAADFAPNSICIVSPTAISNPWLAEIVALNTLVILAATMAIAFFDARLSDQNARAAQALKAVNEELRESEARFRDLTELSSDWYWEQDENLRFTRLSGGVLRKFGWDPKSFIGKSRWDSPLIADDAALTAHKETLAAHKPFQDFVYGMRNAGGTMSYISTSGMPLFEDKGVFRGYRGTGRDVTAQKLAEEALKAEERRLRLMVERLPAGAVFVSGESLYLNPRVEKITGYKLGDLPTLGAWFEALYPGKAEEIRGLYEADKAAGFPVPRVVPITRKDGAQRLLEFSAYGDGSGEVWLINDVTERVHAEEKFRVLFEHSSDAHLLFDENGIIDCNNAALAMVGCTDRKQILGLHPAVLSPEAQPDGRTSAEKSVEMDAIARQRGYHRFEWLHRRLDGTEFPVEVTLTPVTLGGKPVMLTVWHDLTERKHKEAEILRAQEQLRLSLVGSKLALFEWNVSTGEVFLSERWAEILGERPKPTRTTMDLLARQVHPDDFAGVNASVMSLLKGDSAFYDAEHRVRTASGAWIWIRSQGQVAERDARGRAVRVSGTNADITQRKQSEKALRDAHEQMRSGVTVLEQRNREISLLAELSNFLLSCVTVEEACNAIPRYGERLFPNTQCALFLMRSSRDYLIVNASWGDPVKDYPAFRPEDCWALRRGRMHAVSDLANDPVCAHVASGEAEVRQPYLCVPLIVQSELIGLLWIAFTPGTSLSGERQLAVALSEQIALAISNIRLREDLRQQTIRDPLTSLYNRRFLEESLNREIARCRRSGSGFALLMIDVDHFKRFNDTYGHDAGDSVLRTVGRALQEVCREGDIACRFGGEEFVVVLPDTDREGAVVASERILAFMRNLTLRDNTRNLGSITVSVGLALFPEHGETVKDIVQSADKALYAAKGAGRNRLITAGQETQYSPAAVSAADGGSRGAPAAKALASGDRRKKRKPAKDRI